MTREEAIDIIKYGMEISKYPSRLTLTVAEVEEAKQIAIKALSQGPCEDAISRDAAIKTVHKMRVVCDTEDIDDYYELLVESFKQLPSVTQKSGKWIKVTNGRGGHECDICHEYAPSYQDGDEYLTKFCPNCGAKMESEDKE